MEEHSKSNPNINKVNKQFIKKYKSYLPSSSGPKLEEKPKRLRYLSCSNITNFVPKISPKKSAFKPSLFVLNPDDDNKKIPQNFIEHNLKFLDNSDSDSDSDDNSFNSNSSIECDSNEKNKNDIDKEKIKDPDEELTKANSNQEFESINDNNNEVINNDSNFDDNEGNNKYLSIFEVLSMNYK